LFSPSCETQVLFVQASEASNSPKKVIRAADLAVHHVTTNNAIGSSVVLSSKASPEVTYKAREMVAYDDLF
jgi:hypothetical protein